MRNYTKQLFFVHLRFNFNWVSYVFLFATHYSPQAGTYPGWKMLQSWVKATRCPWMLPPLSWENKGAFFQPLTVWTQSPWFAFHCLLKNNICTWSGLMVCASIYCTVPPWTYIIRWSWVERAPVLPQIHISQVWTRLQTQDSAFPWAVVLPRLNFRIIHAHAQTTHKRNAESWAVGPSLTCSIVQPVLWTIALTPRPSVSTFSL